MKRRSLSLYNSDQTPKDLNKTQVINAFKLRFKNAPYLQCMPKDTQQNTFFSWPKAAVTISTLPEQTHNNSINNINLPKLARTNSQ
jgi:hypothetical protein